MGYGEPEAVARTSGIGQFDGLFGIPETIW